jgi:hypothetical protein
MPNITGTATTHNLPNYIGMLYTATPAETPLLNLIAEKAVKTDNFQFATGAEYSIAAPAQPGITEEDSLNAPSAVGYARSQNTNVTQIFQEAINVSYSRLANSGRLSGVTSLSGAEPENELDFQTARTLEKIARDVEYTFINGVYQLSTAANVANKTRGIANACATEMSMENALLSKEALNGVFKAAYDAGATFTDMVLLCGSDAKQQITEIYSAQYGAFAPSPRELGGNSIMRIETDFGVVSVVLSRFVPAGTIIGADVSCIRPVEQDVPEKGNFFREALSKTGAAEGYQIFGQIGLDHGPSWKHFKITDIAASYAV